MSNRLTICWRYWKAEEFEFLALLAKFRKSTLCSFWHADRAYVFLNVHKSAERLRFDLAHELGHLCMHRGIHTNRSRQFELDANIFASTFLMPRNGLLPQIVGRVRFQDIITLKRHWRVSATAMVRRLHRLGRLTDWQYRTWMVDLSQMGFRTTEPDGISREQSSLLRQVMSLAREDGWSLRRLATQLGIPLSDLNSALMGLTVTPLPSASNDFSAYLGNPEPMMNNRVQLRRV